MTQAHIFVTGFVQGVGFRQFVKKQARAESVTGWVRNLPDGRVEAVLQGSKEHVEKVIEACRKGSFLSEVESVEFEWVDATKEFSTFEVRNMPS